MKAYFWTLLEYPVGETCYAPPESLVHESIGSAMTEIESAEEMRRRNEWDTLFLVEVEVPSAKQFARTHYTMGTVLRLIPRPELDAPKRAVAVGA